MGLRSRSVSSVAGMGMDPAAAGAVPFGLYAAAARAAGEAERAPGGGGGGPVSDSTYAHGNGFQETGGGHHRDGMLYLGARASLADALPLHIAPRWFSSHSGRELLDILVQTRGGGGGTRVFGLSPALLGRDELHSLDLAALESQRVTYRAGFKCPICSKSVASDEMEMHFIMCLSKPRLSYNDDVLTKDAGECVICLEELLQGDTIARLPCLCIYHKSCIDSWFEVNRSCPEHPSD
ncbi:E3 ubiquitin-protein ligase ZNRF1 [Willisornis vidua]|uniref:E3 ubiquitin-protein ligase ZNRF1 n=1 Tax=Willisornis vidua TaxID=1566151 RepID=A0ABQ9DV87_9PASS|nr:E3 ubiquitin-protein ligase ZNRF1 [Willisornis vidua]